MISDGGGAHTISAWDTLAASPILSGFAWSPLVDSIAEANLPLLLDSAQLLTRNTSPVLPRMMEGLLAIHLRRGDFIEHCRYLQRHKLDYAVWNAFPDYPDRMTSRNTGDLYTKHCLPTVEQVVQRIQEVKRDWESSSPGTSESGRQLQKIYIMTNAEPSFLAAVRSALTRVGWESVTTSHDLVIPAAAIEVDMAADMLIGERAEVFLGNAVSLLVQFTASVRPAQRRWASLGSNVADYRNCTVLDPNIECQPHPTVALIPHGKHAFLVVK